MTAKFYYKCRMCGEVYDSGTATAKDNGRQVLLETILDIPYSKKTIKGNPVGREKLHTCNNQQVGVADLIGYKIEEA